MKNKTKINLTLFGNDKDFFESAFEEAYQITGDEPSDVIDDVVEPPQDEVDDNVDEVIEEPNKPSEELTKEQVKEMYEKYYGSEQESNNDEEYEEDIEVDERTQSAIELFEYLEKNPHLVQAMRNVDSEGYQNLNNYVPDELTRKINELEEFKRETQYERYVSGLKSKFNDFDEEKVLQYAEDRDILDLEVAYKAMKADSMQEPNIDEIKAQIRKELMEELKNNSLNTQSIIGGASQKPINQSNEISLNSKEQRIAKAMGLTPTEYYNNKRR